MTTHGPWEHFDPETSTVTVVNESDVPTESVHKALVIQHPEIAEMVRWTMTSHGDNGRSRMGYLYQRDRYVTPERIFEQFRVAYDAAYSDDVVSGVLETTEALAINRVNFMCPDADEENIWNQVLLDTDMVTFFKQVWRELFIFSNAYVSCWWAQRSYKVKGDNPLTGYKRKKSFDNLTVPLAFSLLDPSKVTPVGNMQFDQDQIAFIADRTEVEMLDAAVLNDPQADPVSRQMIMAKYAPPDYERRLLARQGINPDWLYIMNPKMVFRICLPKPQYERFSPVRMKSVFELLDLKHQLKQMDRAYLIGSTNFLILVRKGTDTLPAKPEEVNQLKAQVSSMARIPILVGDHRLSVEIVTPKLDLTLNPDKYSVIDARLTTRLYQMFLVHGGMGQPRSDDSVKIAKVISRVLEARRQLIRRAFEQRVFIPMVDANEELTEVPTLRFHPAQIELDFDPNRVQFIMDARDRGDISRDTYLNQLDIDQSQEAILRQREAVEYDKVFTPTNVPFSAPGPGHNVPVGPGGKPNLLPEGDEPTEPAESVPPHAHNPDGTVTAVPGGQPGAKASTRKNAGTTSTPVNPRSAGRRMGGNKNGGGANPGAGKPPPRGLPGK